MTIAVNLGRKATKNKKTSSLDILHTRKHHVDANADVIHTKNNMFPSPQWGGGGGGGGGERGERHNYWLDL